MGIPVTATEVAPFPFAGMVTLVAVIAKDVEALTRWLNVIEVKAKRTASPGIEID
jgi:hypothetical protein